MTLLVMRIPPVRMRDILLQSRLHYPEFTCRLFHLNPYIVHFHSSQESGDEVRYVRKRLAYWKSLNRDRPAQPGFHNRDDVPPGKRLRTA